MNSLVGKLAIITSYQGNRGRDEGLLVIACSSQCTPLPPSILRDRGRSKHLRGELGNASSLRSTADLKLAKALPKELSR